MNEARIVLSGATGRTGNAVAHALAEGGHADVSLVACVAPSVGTTPTRPLPSTVPAFATVAEAIEQVDATVLVELAPA